MQRVKNAWVNKNTMNTIKHHDRLEEKPLSSRAERRMFERIFGGKHYVVDVK